MHFVYMVRCADGTLYTGYARDPERRTQSAQHRPRREIHRPASSRLACLLGAVRFAQRGAEARARGEAACAHPEGSARAAAAERLHRRRRHRAQRQHHAEGRALPFAAALGLDRAAMHLDDVLRDGEPQPQAAVQHAWSRFRPGGNARTDAAETTPEIRCPCR